MLPFLVKHCATIVARVLFEVSLWISFAVQTLDFGSSTIPLDSVIHGVKSGLGNSESKSFSNLVRSFLYGSWTWKLD